MLFDTSAWIEFLSGTKQGKKVADVLHQGEHFTSIVSLAELVNWCLRNNLENDIGEYVAGVRTGSKILPLEEEIVLIAGRLNCERKKTLKNWGMLDSLIVSTALFCKLSVLTKDSQFKDLPNAVML